MNKSNKQTITEGEKLQLIGLRVLSVALYEQIELIKKQAQKITGEVDNDGIPEEFGHTSDYLGEGRELDDMLRILGLSVAEEELC